MELLPSLRSHERWGCLPAPTGVVPPVCCLRSHRCCATRLLSSQALVGSATAIHSGVALVGAAGATVGAHAKAGVVKVYRDISGVWTLEATLQSPSPTAGGRFGVSVSYHNGIAVVGAEGEVAAYLFTRTAGALGAGTWAVTATLTATGIDGCIHKGYGFAAENSVAVHSGWAAVGARGVRRG